MKNIFLLVLVLYVSCESLFAQAPFNTIDSVDINNINAAVSVHGDMWWNPVLETAHCEFPNGTQKNCNFASSLWMSGYDGAGNLHIAAQTYRQSGNDYWPGPLDASDTLTYATANAWAKIWKVNLTDIDTFLSLPTHTIANTPQSILTWPGKGNIHAQGNGGIPLTVTSDMAPFMDLNGNGIYEPLLGEYPAIKGNQTLWWVFSDNGPVHNQTNGRPLGVEVHAMAYGFKRGTLIDDVIYYEYNIVNKSANNYNNFRIAEWNDGIIGYQFDNYCGFDSIWRMSIIYKGTNCDGCGAGSPINGYGLNPPQTAITMIVLPGDEGTNYVPIGCFDYYVNDASIKGNPAIDSQFNNYMRSKARNGESLTKAYLTDTLSYPCGNYDSTAIINYLDPGDPSDTTSWNACTCNEFPGDRRTVFSSNDFNLNAGSSQRVVFALLVADTAKGCPLASFNDIKIVADTAWGNYFQNASGVKNIVSNNGGNIYPNPAHNLLYLENSVPNTGEENITFYNIIGQKLNVPISGTGNKRVADLSGLPNGIYLVEYRNSNIQLTTKFIKD